MEQVPLRRVFSCEDLRNSIRTNKSYTPAAVDSYSSPQQSETQASVSTAVCTSETPTTIRAFLSSAQGIVASKLREALQNALDEVVTSIISFFTYGVLLFLVRQYSALAVGVSFDLGAFSIEL
ncbi:hypothetical protein P43SY_002888 [Pythium insidiosum]|uniref:Uncharacterized protein n=1 Tax=Pythium insidiosum TaxID=114742 RepID=A0AAD5LUW4_PYTIN|nr:hypothetical protein P43SY_002888 [Pythium insidiosum]